MRLLIATNDGVQTLLEGDGEDDPLVALIPGDDMALHRMTLVETDAAPRREEAAMRATDLAARPIEDLHVAVGPPDAQGESWIGIIDRERMAGHLAHLEAAGVKAAHIVPAALMLQPADDDGPALARFGDRVLMKSADLAGLFEPQMAGPLAGSSQLGRMARMSAFQPSHVPDPLPLDLLQGDFAPRTKWWKDRRFRIRAAVLGLLVILLAMAPVAIERGRSATQVAVNDRAVIELAEATLGTRPASAEAGAAALAAARRTAEGAALASRLTAVSLAVRDVPGARLESVRLQPDGRLLVGLGGSADAINALGARMATAPFETQLNGATLSVGDRQAGRASNRSPLSLSMLRLVQARSDAALVAAAKARGGKLPGAQVTAAFAAAGLAQPSASGIDVPAARSTALLPLLADVELRGATFTTAEVSRNADQTLSARFTVAP